MNVSERDELDAEARAIRETEENMVEIREIYVSDWFTCEQHTEWRLYENGQWYASFRGRAVAMEYALAKHPGWTVVVS